MADDPNNDEQSETKSEQHHPERKKRNFLELLKQIRSGAPQSVMIVTGAWNDDETNQSDQVKISQLLYFSPDLNPHLNLTAGRAGLPAPPRYVHPCYQATNRYVRPGDETAHPDSSSTKG
mmetsp:Transcript_19884/g.35478  ORF Transcript_19884/g.35478 Transcript_19884/m.35478 type:complete len:120 (-) Transcript_19884:952-1311(-)